MIKITINALSLISESIIFQNFLGGMPPVPLVLAYFACSCALHTMTVHIPTIPTSTIITNLIVPPFQKSEPAPGLIHKLCDLDYYRSHLYYRIAYMTLTSVINK